MRVMFAMVIAGVACSSTHTSRLPPYVRELRAAPGGVEVISCEIVFTETTSMGWSWLRLSSSSETEREIAQGPCWRVVVPTEAP